MMMVSELMNASSDWRIKGSVSDALSWSSLVMPENRVL